VNILAAKRDLEHDQRPNASANEARFRR